MILHSVWQKCFDFLPGKPIVVEPVAAAFSSDAGLLPIRQFDERLGLTAGFVAALEDPRCPHSIEHTLAEMVRSRIYGIVAGRFLLVFGPVLANLCAFSAGVLHPAQQP